MKRHVWFVTVAIAVVVTGLLSRRSPGWDSKGWIMVGERTVNGRLDHRIEVGTCRARARRRFRSGEVKLG